MTLFEEAAKDLRRAIELKDWAAVKQIIHDVGDEAGGLPFDDLAEWLKFYLKREDLATCRLVVAGMAHRAVDIDLAAGRRYGAGYLLGAGHILVVTTPR